jgi:hypothetical protein
MRGPYVVSLAVLVPLAAACAKGDTGEIGGVGGSSSSTGSTSGQGGGGAQDGGSSTSTSSTTGSSSGGVPATCAAAHDSVGCCNDGTVYYCKSGETTLTATSCTGSKVCGWEASESFYTCVAAPGGADPTNANPEACN